MTDPVHVVVVLVPGLGLGGLEMVVLARRLRRRGWPVTIFRHFPWRGSLDDKASALAALCRSLERDTVHLVAHSMGGNIVLHCLAAGGTGASGRVVLLGSPVNDSAVARRIAALPLGNRILGRCMGQVSHTAFDLPREREVGGIAGRYNLGVGRLLGVVPPCDGVVRVNEALHGAMNDTRIVNDAHTGMLFSRHVADLVDVFLRRGRFALSSADD